MKCWQQPSGPSCLALLICSSLIREVHFTSEEHYSVRGVKGTAVIHEQQMAKPSTQIQTVGTEMDA